MTAGFLSPLPPARSGVADHAWNLLRALRRLGEVELDPARADVNLYHLGNNQLHAAIYRRALEQPGVIVLHDAVLHHFALGYFDREDYIAEFAYNYGEWSRDLAAELWSARSRSAGDARYFAYPMLRRIVERSRAVVVHNPAAARIVRAHSAGTPVVEIPLLFAEPERPDAASILEARQRLGAVSRDCLCGVFGYLRESKRISRVIRACERIGARLLLAGDMPADLERALEPHLEKPWIVRRAHTPESEFWTLAHAVDICVNLRYPAAGETSAIGVSMMGIGKPVLVTASEEVSKYPDTACVRIEQGLGEQSELEEALRWLARFPFDAREIGNRAARHIGSFHGPAQVAEKYWEVLRPAAG